MRARKRFGQNFLNDQNQIQKIVTAINPTPDQNLLEIGPGHGAITRLIIETGCNLSVVEIDRDLVAELRMLYPSLNVIEADVLKFDFSRLADTRLRVVGNLPYNISTPLLFRLFNHIDIIFDMHFMLQLEVVERLVASAGEKNYGRLSIMSQYYCQSIKLFEVPPESFTPRPKVMSAIVKLTPKTDRNIARDEKLFADMVNHAFSMRRKTLRNGLKKYLSAEQIETAGINPAERPENVSLEEFITLANAATSEAK